LLEFIANKFKNPEFAHLFQIPIAKDERDAIVSLSLASLTAKLQSGSLKAVDVLRAYQDKVLEFAHVLL
jgi:hypothetical protein